MREDRSELRQEMKEHMNKQENYQNERIKVMKETNELLRMLLTGKGQEE